LPFCKRAGYLAVTILAVGCGSGGDPSHDAVQEAVPVATGFRALPLGSFSPKVPPLKPSEWLQAHFDWYVLPQGEAPKSWPEIERDIRPEACGTCHQQQYKDWKESFHHKAMGPGVLGQLLDMELDAPALSISCQRCHAPLAEQIPYLQQGKPNPDYIEGFREQGITCAACHVRNHVRHGPDRGIKPDPDGPHGGFVIRSEYKDPAFCASCHDFAPGGGVHGKMLLETAEEWRRTDFAAEGQTCQSCHMPEGRHLWKGIHDPDMVRSAVSVEAAFGLTRTGDSLRAGMTVTNTGAGHRLPTYNIPHILLVWEQRDGTGSVLPGTRVQEVIARWVTEEVDHEFYDTRLMPGQSMVLPYRGPRHPRAVEAVARVEVWPDEAYRRYFQRMLDTPELRPGVPAGVDLIEEAHAMAGKSRYVLWRQRFPLDPPAPGSVRTGSPH
jgi:hypothetical protein